MQKKKEMSNLFMISYTIHRKVYVDFMYDKNERSWYKTLII